MEIPMFSFVSLRRIAFALSVAAVLGFVGPVAAGEQVPFHGVFEGDYTVTPIPSTPTATLVVSAEGIANQLGFFDLEIPHVVNFATMSATGAYHFRAAHGDKVNATFTGHSTPIGTDGVYVLVVEDVTITGGTGRFAGATGEFTTVRLVDRVNLRTIGYIDGTISRPRHH
jgi:hypothetical protein